MNMTARRRLIQIMLAPGDGGAETFFEKLAIAFQEAGLEQKLIICEHEARCQRLRAAGCDVVEIPAQGWRKWLAKGAVRRLVDEFTPDLQLAWMSRAAGTLERRPGCVNVARLGGYYPLKYYRNCDWLVGNTPSVISHLEQLGWPSAQTRLITNFGELPDEVRTGTDLREALQIPEDAPVLLTMGRLHVNKAQDILLEALAMVPAACLLIAGEGPLERQLKSQAARLGITDRIRFLGWRRDAPALYNVADVCVFPSRQEPLGNVVLEAWAHSVPIVAAASEGPSWLIDHESNGLLFPVDDAVACAAAINRMLGDAELAACCQRGGRTKWRAEFSKEAIVQGYLEFFQEISQHSMRIPEASARSD